MSGRMMTDRLNHKIVCCKTIDDICMLCLKIVVTLTASEEFRVPCDSVDSYRKEFHPHSFMELQEFTQRDPFGDNLDFFKQCITPVSSPCFLFLRNFSVSSRRPRRFRSLFAITFCLCAMSHCATAITRNN